MLKVSNLTGFNTSGATASAPAAADMFVWGNNGKGQAGGGGSTPTNVPVPTETDTTDGIVIPSASFSAAQHMAFIVEGELYTTGLNNYGQLGFGNEVDKDEFTKVTTNGDATDFALNEQNSYTIRDGKVNGCGRNNLSQLTSSQSSPNGILNFDVLFEPTSTGGANASKVFASRNSGGVLTADNRAWVWGGQVGYLFSEATTNPVPVNVTDFVNGSILDDVNLTSIALGDEHLIILDESGNAYTTSLNNDYGACGRQENCQDSEGGRPCVPDPLADVGLAMTGVSKIAAGRYTSYLIADGILYAAGRGDSGEMGGATSDSFNNDFINIGGAITDWIDVQAGDAFVIAQRQDGTVYHSGMNSNFQQGNNVAGADVFGFVQVDGGTTAKVYSSYTTIRRTVYGIS